MGWLRRLRRTVGGSKVQDDIDREIAFHLEADVRAHVAQGLTAEEARRRFGHPTLAREETADVDVLRWLQGTLQDARYAARALYDQPGFAAAAILTLALGVGATTAIFSVVYGVLLRPLPYRDINRLVLVQTRNRTTGQVYPIGFSLPNLKDWTESARSFEALALASSDIFALDVGGALETIHGAYVSRDFFAVLGARLALGRAPNNVDEVVLSDRLWRQRLGADPRVVGREIRLNGRPFAVAGVAGPAIEVPTERRLAIGAPAVTPELWAPIDASPFAALGRKGPYYQPPRRWRPTRRRSPRAAPRARP
jgi:putative ABC transport system permease protein